LTAKIIGIKTYLEKGGEGKVLTQAELKEGEGISGGRHNDISLLTKDAHLFAEQNPGGLCFGKFKENLLIDADLQDVNCLTLGDAILEIIGGKKFCHKNCIHFSEENECHFRKGVAFAKVVQGGMVFADGEKSHE
jgi:MOSC domain-containing protein YiiM